MKALAFTPWTNKDWDGLQYWEVYPSTQSDEGHPFSVLKIGDKLIYVWERGDKAEVETYPDEDATETEFEKTLSKDETIQYLKDLLLQEEPPSPQKEDVLEAASEEVEVSTEQELNKLYPATWPFQVHTYDWGSEQNRKDFYAGKHQNDLGTHEMPFGPDLSFEAKKTAALKIANQEWPKAKFMDADGQANSYAFWFETDEGEKVLTFDADKGDNLEDLEDYYWDKLYDLEKGPTTVDPEKFATAAIPSDKEMNEAEKKFKKLKNTLKHFRSSRSELESLKGDSEVAEILKEVSDLEKVLEEELKVEEEKLKEMRDNYSLRQVVGED